MPELMLNSINGNLQQAAGATQEEVFHEKAYKAEQKLIKDLISASVAVGGANLSSKQEDGKVVIMPPIPNPNPASEGGGLDDGDNFSIIALIGEALILQAKTNSLVWNSFFQQASLNMRQAVEMAPLIAMAIRSTFDKQADQSKAESDMAWNNALISGAMFLGAVALGGKDVFNEVKSAPDKAGLEAEFENKGLDTEGMGAGSKAEDLEAKEEEAIYDSNVDGSSEEKVVDQEQKRIHDEQAAGGPGKRFQDKLSWGKNKAGTYAKYGLMALEKAVGKSQLFGMLSTFGTQLNESIQKDNIAAIQRETGKYEAASKEMEQFAQYWNQLFQRTEDLRQGTQQFIDLSMNILKSLSDSVTSTVQSMFRG